MFLNPKYYRIRLLLDVLRILILPSISFSLATRYSGVRLGCFSVPANVLAIVAWNSVRNIIYDIQQRRNARRLGAKQVPRIRGKWPGNIDILLRMMKAFKTAYPMDVYLQLFREYRCTTLNARILWVDQV